MCSEAGVCRVAGSGAAPETREMDFVSSSSDIALRIAIKAWHGPPAPRRSKLYRVRCTEKRLIAACARAKGDGTLGRGLVCRVGYHLLLWHGLRRWMPWALFPSAKGRPWVSGRKRRHVCFCARAVAAMLLWGEEIVHGKDRKGSMLTPRHVLHSTKRFTRGIRLIEPFSSWLW